MGIERVDVHGPGEVGEGAVAFPPPGVEETALKGGVRVFGIKLQNPGEIVERFVRRVRTLALA